MKLFLSAIRSWRSRIVIVAAILLTAGEVAGAAPVLDPGDPVGFFTNVASRLLAAQLKVDLSQIQVYPTNRYTPAVHRLLQLSANVLEAASTNVYPTVFRPTFWVTNVDGGLRVCLSGYQQVVLDPSYGNPLFDPQLALPMDAAALSPGARTNNVYGVPWIIGARKGFPNFNEFSMESIVWITRRLEITRPSVNALLSEYQTNQMYILSISNVLGVECWNSYYSNYTSVNPIQIVARDSLSMTLTNEEAGGATMIPRTASSFMANLVTLPQVGGSYTWPGSAPWSVQRYSIQPSQYSFDLPLLTNMFVLTNEGYVYQFHGFVPAENGSITTNYVDPGIQPLPEFRLQMTNRLQVVMLDGYHIVDYVQFAGPESCRNLNAEIADFDQSNPNLGVWNTNVFSPGSATPWGVVNQIYYSQNPQVFSFFLTPNDTGTWGVPPGFTVGMEIALLNAFLSPNHVGIGTDPNTGKTYFTTNLNLFVQVPFSPVRITYEYISWQANDPLVHYLASDLNYTGYEMSGLQTGVHQLHSADATNNLANNLGQLNDRYMPWAGRPMAFAGVDTNAFNLAFRDPLMRFTDDWNFPTNGGLTAGSLGRIHRGTPWQSIYLKAADVLGETQNGANIGTNTWMVWTGDFDVSDAAAMAPVADHRLAGQLAHLLGTNDFQSLFAVNNTDPNAWLVRLDGLIALSNNLPDTIILRLGSAIPAFDIYVVSSNSDQALVIANALQAARAGQTGQYFRHVGDVLTSVQLTEQSPFLDWNNIDQRKFGITDDAYEQIPSQLLPLLSMGSIGSIAPASGQWQVQFTGSDGQVYVTQVSSNLLDWVNVNTNSPIDEAFSFMVPETTGPGARFYRSKLMR